MLLVDPAQNLEEFKPDLAEGGRSQIGARMLPGEQHLGAVAGQKLLVYQESDHPAAEHLFQRPEDDLLGQRVEAPGHPEAQNAPEPAREAQNGVDSRSGILQTPKELVESPFPLRNQTWKETFCSWTRKPNSYP